MISTQAQLDAIDYCCRAVAAKNAYLFDQFPHVTLDDLTQITKMAILSNPMPKETRWPNAWYGLVGRRRLLDYLDSVRSQKRHNDRFSDIMIRDRRYESQPDEIAENSLVSLLSACKRAGDRMSPPTRLRRPGAATAGQMSAVVCLWRLRGGMRVRGCRPGLAGAVAVTNISVSLSRALELSGPMYRSNVARFMGRIARKMRENKGLRLTVRQAACKYADAILAVARRENNGDFSAAN